MSAASPSPEQTALLAAKDERTGQLARALRMLEVLAAELPQGLANKDIAARLGVAPSAVTRTVDELVALGWAERLAETGRVRISYRVGQLIVDVEAGFARAARHMATERANYGLRYSVPA